MNELRPRLSINRSVLNITDEVLSGIYQKPDESGDRTWAAQKKILKPAGDLRANIIQNKEIKRYHNFIGKEINPERMRNLRTYFQSVLLPLFASEISTPTLPSLIHPFNSGDSRQVVSIAGSREIITERQLAKRAIDSYDDVDTYDKEEIWEPDEYATRVVLVRRPGAKMSQVKIVDVIHERLTGQPQGVPTDTRFGAANVHTVGVED